ncbi:Ger(x)C family spore germination protein [Bacillus hwajinpoensis]|uniref:Ger(X)C family spore germination protein n=1 Tax=Guptibacillus hwajinpoensis TaxID=208199 RepID=A0A845EVI6_9BACL|nr:Ger(x)C family spore germination protein [Pseudalkalibacillus hwajinpoensis]MYL62148.1 Ger(x)C family spore germination protein [Pseudalkalibacillus hwajinpoensis]
MKRTFNKFVSGSLILFLLSGCWDANELNELAIAVAYGIDKVEDEYLVTAQVVNPGEIEQAGITTPVTVYQENAKTLLEAFRRMTTIAPRKIYGSHLRVLVIGEQVAKEGIGDVIDLLSRDPEIRNDFYIVVSRNAKAGDTLQVLTSLEDIPANKLYAALETSEKNWAPTLTVTLDQLSAHLMEAGMEPMLTGVEVKGEISTGESRDNVAQIKPQTQLQYHGTAVFRGNKLVGWLNDPESKGVHYALNRVKSTIVVVPCENGGKTGIELIDTDAELKAKAINHQPYGTIKVQVEGKVSEVECRELDLSKRETISELEEKTEKDIEEKIKEALKVTQLEYESDVFGFGKAMHRSSPAYWKTVEKNWDEQFKNLPVDITVDVTIRRTGTIGNSPIKRMEE